MKPAPKHVCPRCGHFVPNDATPGEYPGALSRYDNETEVCSACGVQEAMAQMFRGSLGLDRDMWFDRLGVKASRQGG